MKPLLNLLEFYEERIFFFSSKNVVFKLFFMHFKLVHFMLAMLTLVKWQRSVWRVDLLPVPC